MEGLVSQHEACLNLLLTYWACLYSVSAPFALPRRRRLLRLYPSFSTSSQLTLKIRHSLLKA